MTEFNLQRINRSEVQILSLIGYMGNDEFSRVHRELSHLLEQGHLRVVLDLASLSFATTMSLARLLVCAREFRRRGGELRMAGLSPFLSRLALLAGFGRKHDLEADVPTALKAIAQPRREKTNRPREKRR